MFTIHTFSYPHLPLPHRNSLTRSVDVLVWLETSKTFCLPRLY